MTWSSTRVRAAVIVMLAVVGLEALAVGSVDVRDAGPRTSTVEVATAL